MKIWKKLEVSLLVGLAAALLFGGRLDSAQAALAGKLVRLHVVAHSDRPADQAVKLQVRDQILTEVETLLAGETNLNRAKVLLEQALPELEAASEAVLHQAGADYGAVASLERVYFPTKEYETFALPAGEYTALRIVLGEGAGQNWWCVLFPPLCTGVATAPVEQAAAAAGLTRDEIALITEEEQGYVFRFRCMELWEEIQHLLF